MNTYQLSQSESACIRQAIIAECISTLENKGVVGELEVCPALEEPLSVILVKADGCLEEQKNHNERAVFCSFDIERVTMTLESGEELALDLDIEDMAYEVRSVMAA